MRAHAVFKDYETAHQNRGNQLCHAIGIPLLVVAVLGLLSRATGHAPLDPALFVMALSLIYTAWLDWILTIPYALWLASLFLLSQPMGTGLLWTFFIIGWILQFVGHGVFEKRSPKFVENLKHLLVGPFWIFSRFVK